MGVREALLRANVASAAQIDEALARQQLYGADIVTNLLELVELDEATVQRALAEAYGMSLAPCGELPYAAGAAIELVPRNVASDLNVYPYRLDSSVLTLVSAAPLSERVVLDLGFALKVQLRTLFAVAPRVKQAIARDHAFAIDRRTQKALSKLERGSQRVASDAPPPVTDVRTLSQLPRPRSIAPFGFPENWSDAVTPEAARVLAETARQPEVQAFDENDLYHPPETSRSIFSDFGTGPEFPGARSELPTRERSTPPSSQASLSQRHHRHRGPYTVARAKADLQAARSGDELLDVFFDFAAQYFDTSAVFTLHAGHAQVRDARGTVQSAAELLDKLPLSAHPALRKVSETKQWLLCELRQEDPDLARVLRRERPWPSLLLPVLVRGRTVVVLYGDFDSEPVVLDQVGELLAFCPLVSRAFERLVVARRSGRRMVSQEFGQVRAPRARFSPPEALDRAKALAAALENPKKPAEDD